ncbi:MAG: hypothetical protein HQL73_11025 [Magnetococcales bacterium]|nr:hypothetical protein [Magnetococcales bacterium]
MIQRRRHRGVMVFCGALGLVTQLQAASSTVENRDQVGNVGRYQIYQGQIRGDEGQATLMLDSQLGRVWILTQDKNHGAAWTRVPLAQFNPLQEGYMSRPTTAIPFQRSKAKTPKPDVSPPVVPRATEMKPEADKLDLSRPDPTRTEPNTREPARGDIKIENKP